LQDQGIPNRRIFSRLPSARAEHPEGVGTATVPETAPGTPAERAASSLATRRQTLPPPPPGRRRPADLRGQQSAPLIQEVVDGLGGSSCLMRSSR
jgi:hypothetical protein